MKKIYIAGPMTPTRFDEDHGHGYEHFHVAERKLIAAGHAVFNPATNMRPVSKGGDIQYVSYEEDRSYRPLSSEEWATLKPDEYEVAYREVMQRDLRWIMECDAMALLPGWRRSQGARFEHDAASMFGLEISNVEHFCWEALKKQVRADAEQLTRVPPPCIQVTGRGGLEQPHHPGDVGHDLTCCQVLGVQPGEFADVDCNLKLALPPGTWGLIINRSSAMRSFGLHVVPGVIDGGYRGPIKVGVYNMGGEPVFIQYGQQLAQLIVLPQLVFPVEVVAALRPGDRGEDAFGSTDSPKGGGVI